MTLKLLEENKKSQFIWKPAYIFFRKSFDLEISSGPLNFIYRPVATCVEENRCCVSFELFYLIYILNRDMGRKRDFTERAKSGPGKATKKQNDPKVPKAFGKQGLLKCTKMKEVSATLV